VPKAPRRPPTQELFDFHVAKGWTLYRIAKHYWTSPETVRKWLDEETGIGASVRPHPSQRPGQVRSRVLRVEQRSMETRGVEHHYEVLVLDCGHFKNHAMYRQRGTIVNPPPKTTKCPTCTHRKAQDDGRQGPATPER